MNNDTRPPASTHEDLSALARELDKKLLRLNVSNTTVNGSTKFINALLSILVLLVVAAICGEVIVYGQVQALQVTVNMIIAGKIK